MARWICPCCDREFDRAGQGHVCSPGHDVEYTFRDRPAGQLTICSMIIDELRGCGPVYVDAVGVGVFLKSQRKLAEIRPKSRWVSLELVLPESIDSPRVSRTKQLSERRIVHVIRLVHPEDVDEEIRCWLEQAYDAATD